MAAKRYLGQNFLVDQNIARKIVSKLNPQPWDQVIEIGSGRGALTSILNRYELKLVVFEKDLLLAQEIKAKYPNIFMVGSDILHVDWARVNHSLKPTRIIGCLPYNIASPFLWELVHQFRSFEKMVFTVQKEVALRIVARPGSKIYGALSIWVQSLVKPKYEFAIGPNVFRPRPKVDSAVISFTPTEAETYSQSFENLNGLLRLCFQSRRKQLRKILKSFVTSDINQYLCSQGIDPYSRPEQLSPRQFVALSQTLDYNLRDYFAKT